MDILHLAHKLQTLKITTDRMEKNLAKLNQDDRFTDTQSIYIQKTCQWYNELASIGFGSRELRILLHTIIDITNSNGITQWLAVDKFFKDIENQYDAKLGFESKKEGLML